MKVFLPHDVLAREGKGPVTQTKSEDLFFKKPNRIFFISLAWILSQQNKKQKKPSHRTALSPPNMDPLDELEKNQEKKNEPFEDPTIFPSGTDSLFPLVFFWGGDTVKSQ